MPLIHVLDEVTANQISAGEVVERPVNAVKELVENAVDAGASQIEIEIANGGTSYIRVTDNGSGMSAEDARLSVLRHATSKISTVDNIYHIASLGFRGEALASITAVSRTTISTRRPEDEAGTALTIEGGKVVSDRPVGVPSGTTIEVRDLFYNVPARKKFLKSERAESSRINSMIGKLALANANIAFTLINNGRTVIETPGNGRLRDAVSSLYGTDVSREMLDVKGENEDSSLEGMISKPSLLKSSRQYQTIIVNRRVIESAAISKAVDNAFHSLLPKNGYPLVVLLLTVPPDQIDVNVHPQKREIKFKDESAVFRLVYHSVLETLTSQSSPDAIARNMIHNPGHEIVGKNGFQPGSVRVEEHPDVPHLGLRWDGSREKSGTLFSDSNKGNTKRREERQPDYTPELSTDDLLSSRSILSPYQHKTDEKPKGQEMQESAPLFKTGPAETPVIPLGQVAKCFILCQHGDDLLIIDQHAAHERVRYDHLAARAEGIPVQQILVPYLIQMDSSDVDLLMEHQEELKHLGITFEQAGMNVIRITGTPGDLGESDMERVMNDTVAAYRQDDVPSPETMRHRVMAYAACRGAIKRGDPLNIRQMRELIHDLFQTSRPFVCPHGRPTIVKFTPAELGHLFKRP